MIRLTPLSLSRFDASPLVLAVFAHEDGKIVGAGPLSGAAGKRLFQAAKSDGFKGDVGETISIEWNGRRHVLVGLGKRRGFSEERLRRAAGSLARWARGRLEALAVALDEGVQAAAEGLLLGSYRFEEYKKPERAKLKSIHFIVRDSGRRSAAEEALGLAALACEAVTFIRDLVNRAPSDKSPRAMANVARKLAGSGVGVRVFGRAKAEALGMGSFLGVARGSAAEPAFVHLKYKPKGAGAKKRIALVGKGVTFDSGGLSLKQPQAMETMKLDMAGAAVILGLFKILPRLKPRAEVHGFCPFVCNMPGPDALKPGDVVRAMNGKTVEVLNTDAEGRLILADALSYAAGFKPDAIVDLATLTGAVTTALGSRIAGAMGNDEPLMGRLKAAAARAGEPLWELPLPEDYRDNLKSVVADLLNVGRPRGEAACIIGGMFLKEFVDARPWAHLDIAGTAWSDSTGAYGPAGATGSGARTLIEYLAAL